MSRPLRLEFPGAVYHVTSRGDRREPIYRDDQDRQEQLSVLEQGADRFDAQALAYCLMGNHYHLVLHTRMGNLSRLMRHLNGVYTQRFNRRHGLVGHLFQGRFKAILVDRDNYLFALCRYVERNPVAAGIVATPGDWPWSSCRAHTGQVPTPPWLDSDGLHGYLLGRPVQNAADRRRAAARYAELVQDDADSDLWSRGLRQQVFLGDEGFVERQLAASSPTQKRAREIPLRQRTPPKTLQALLNECASREQALHKGYTEHGLTMSQMSSELGLSVSRVSRLLSAYETALMARGKT